MDVFGLYSLSYGKFFFDQLYDALIVAPLERDGPAVRVVRSTGDRRAGGFWRRACPSGWAPRAPVQNGLIQFYALAMVLGLLVLMGGCCCERMSTNDMATLLLITLFLPLAGALLVRGDRRAARWFALGTTLCTLAHGRRARRVLSRRRGAVRCDRPALAWRSQRPDRRLLQRRHRRPQPVALRTDGAADGRGRAGRLGGDRPAGRRSIIACC